MDQDGSLGTKCTGSWDKFQDVAKRYVKSKKDAGRWKGDGNWSWALPATFNLIEDKDPEPRNAILFMLDIICVYLFN